jgi:hypothetical protein
MKSVLRYSSARWVLCLAAAAGLLAFGTATARSAPDLTATQEEYIGEGITYQRLVFRDDKRRVEMELPQGWSFRNNGPGRLDLVPPKQSAGEASIRVEAAPSQPGFDDAVSKSLVDRAQAAVPVDSQAVEVLQTDKNSLTPGGHEAFDVILSFKRIGVTFRRRMTFVNFPDCQIVLQVTASEAEFKKVDGPFVGAFRSWTWK